MRAVRWLHISDFHIGEAETAQRQTVLSAMLKDISQRSAKGWHVDFVVVSGDLAFSGKGSEYEIVAMFFDDLVAAADISSDKVFCVPGNHDVRRDRSKMCFKGALAEVQSENDVYKFLADDDEREDLLRRQEDYRAFERSYLKDQKREHTDDDLGYVSKLEVDDLRIAIIGLNSSWLAEGGVSDEGKLLIGESQVRSAIDIAKGYEPHVILGLQHHPFDWLQRFDRRPVQRSLEEVCDFMHCGHLHESDVTEVVEKSGHCITITAGASFESREFRNAFTTIEFDPLAGRAEIVFIEYNPHASKFEYEKSKSLDHQIDGHCDCTVDELAEAINLYCEDAGDLSCYLSSLLLGFSSDVPMVSKGTVVFGNWDLVEGISDAAFRSSVADFKGVGRAIKLLHNRKFLNEILVELGDPISSFVGWLRTLSDQDSDVEDYLKMRNKASARWQPSGSGEPLRHTVDLLVDMMENDDWDGTRDLAERTIDLCEGASFVKVARILAFCLALSTDEVDKDRAVELYSQVMESNQADPGDWGALATLKTELGNYDEAKDLIRKGIGRFPTQSQAFVEIGLRLVEKCGDKDFRDWLISKE